MTDALTDAMRLALGLPRPGRAGDRRSPPGDAVARTEGSGTDQSPRGAPSSSSVASSSPVLRTIEIQGQSYDVVWDGSVRTPLTSWPARRPEP